MNKVSSLILTIIICTLALCSCGKREAADKGYEFERIGLNELSNNIEAAKNGSYETLRVGEHIKVNIPEKISDMHITGKALDLTYAQKLVEHYGFSEKIALTANDDPLEPYVVKYHDDSSHFFLTKSGQMNYATDDKTYDDSELEIIANEKATRIYIDKAGKDEEILFCDKSVRISELVERAKSHLDEYSELINSVKFIPVYLEYKSYECIIYFTLDYNGYYSTFYEAKISLEEKDPQKTDFFAASEQCYVIFTDADTLSGFVEQNGKITAEYTGEGYDEIISLSSALKYLDSEIAENLVCEIDHISLVQINKDTEVHIIENEEDIDYNHLDLAMDTHPCWQFVMHASRNENERFAALIDCITGKLSFSEIY